MIRKRLGELLIEAGLIDEYQLQSALGHQRQWGGRLGQILVHMKLVDEGRMVRVLATQLGVAVADAPPDDLHVRVLGELSLDIVVQHHVFPLAIRRDAKGDQLALAMTDPTNVAAIDAVQFTTGKKVVPFLAGDSAIEAWIRRHYQGERVVQASGLAATVDEASAQMGVQFGGQLVDLGAAASDDDDIPVVTGAMVAASSPTADTDPFAGLAPMAGANVPTTTVPSARFAAIVPGVATSMAFAGTGLATLDPVVGDAAGAWDKHVEQAATAAAATSPSFGPAGGFLGADDDDNGASAPPPPLPPVADDPFAALTIPPVDLPVVVAPPASVVAAPVEAPVLDPVLDLSEPVLDLADLAEPITPVPAPTPPAIVATLAPSWGDLLDAPAPAGTTPLAAPLEAEPDVVATDPAVDDNPFVRAPITADAYPPLPEPPVGVEAFPVAVEPSQTCPRCSNVRVDAARFCPFCGLSFVDVPTTPLAEAHVAAVVAEAPVDFDISEPSGPFPVAAALEAPAVDIDIGPVEEASAVDVDIGLAPVDEAPGIDIDIGLAPVDEAPLVVEAPVDIDIDIGPVDEAPLVVEVPAADIGLAPVDAAPVVVDAPAVDIDIGLAPIDEAPLVVEVPAVDIGLAPVDEAPLGVEVPAVDIDIGLAPIDGNDAVDTGLASQWADAAEQMIPRKETDRRNDVGWVPPSRELVVTPPPAAPVPEPIVAYTPAAPAPPAPAPAAPWAVFAPAAVVVDEPPATPLPPAPAADAWVVPASNARLADEAPALDDATATIDDDAIALPSSSASLRVPALAAEPLVTEAVTVAPEVPPTTDDVVELADVSDIAVSVDEPPAPLALTDDAFVALPAPTPAPADDFGLDIDFNEPSGPMTPSPAAAQEAVAVEPAIEPVEIDDIELVDLPLEPPVELPASASAPPPLTAESPPLSTMVGWGDMIDAPASFAPPSVLPHISVPTFMPPATLTPPPMSLHRPPTLEQIVAPPSLSSPLVPPPPPLSSPPSWVTATELDDPFSALPDLPVERTPRVESTKPQRVTATMVMKLDPAEQKRLLEMLLSKTEINADALSTPPTSADGDPDKGT